MLFGRGALAVPSRRLAVSRLPSPVSRLAVALSAAGILAATDARADWPHFTLVYSGTENEDFPIGAAIRNWGPTDDVFIAWDVLIPTAAGDLETENEALFKHYVCSDNDDCATTSASATIAMGDPVNYQNALHPSLGIKRAPPAGAAPPYLLQPVETRLLIRQDAGDCDLDGDDATDGAAAGAPEREGLDLHAFHYDEWSGHDPVNDVTRADIGTYGVCEDHGFSRTRFRSGVAHTCFTFDTAPLVMGISQKIACNDDTYVSALSWAGHRDLSNLDTLGSPANEDHPGFDFFGSTGVLGVAGHQKVGANSHFIRAHFPVATSPPTETVITLDTASVELNNPDVFAANGFLHTVWQRNTETAAGILYRRCDVEGARSGGGTKDCKLLTDWDATESVVDSTTLDVTGKPYVNRSARFPQLAIDGKRQFVVYQYDDDSSLPLFKTRVMVASRCEGDATWDVELVRTPDATTDDQAIVYGRPSIVVNADENVVHVAFVEFDEYLNGFEMETPDDSDLFWYRTGYSSCP